MAKIKKAVFDAGPFIHLHEIDQLPSCKVFSVISTTPEILDECKRMSSLIEKMKNVQQRDLSSKGKDFAQYLIAKYTLHLGEATGISLCKQEKIRLFFTDDLDARTVAQTLGFEPHGTLAILLRAFSEKFLTEKKVLQAIDALYNDSSLFLTKDLRDWTIKEVKSFKKR